MYVGSLPVKSFIILNPIRAHPNITNNASPNSFNIADETMDEDTERIRNTTQVQYDTSSFNQMTTSIDGYSTLDSKATPLYLPGKYILHC